MTLVLASLLSACGGGGGGGGGDTPKDPELPPITGRVIDGYVQGAIVFWDCNRNGMPDAGEVQATSGLRGVYQIADRRAAQCPLLAQVGPGAIDEDQPLQRGRAYTLQAAPGAFDLITPFTTLVAGQVETAGLRVDAAAAEVASIFGLTGGVLADYKAGASAPHAAAAMQITAELESTLAMPGPNSHAARMAFERLRTAWTDSGLLASITMGFRPFAENFRSLALQASAVQNPNPGYRVVRRYEPASLDDADALDAIAKAVNQASGARHGYIDWQSFSTAQLKVFARTINRLNADAAGSPHAARLAQLQQRRSAMFQAAATRLERSVGYDGDLVGTWRFFSSDPGATLEYAVEAITISGDIAVDVVTLAMPRPTVGRPSNLTNYKKKLAQQLEIYDFMVSAQSCLADLRALDAATDMAAPLVAVVSSCGSFVVDNLNDLRTSIRTNKATESFAAALKAAGPGYEGWKEQDVLLAQMKTTAATLGLMHDLLGLFIKDPVTAKLLSVLDLGVQFVNARVAAMELEAAATQALEQTTKTAIERYHAEVEKAWRSYFISFMEVFGSYYFRAVDSTTCPPDSTLDGLGECQALPPPCPSNQWRTQGVCVAMVPDFSLELDPASIAAVGGVHDGVVFGTGRNGGAAAGFPQATFARLRIPNRPSLQFTREATIDFWATIDPQIAGSWWTDLSQTPYCSELVSKGDNNTGMSFSACPDILQRDPGRSITYNGLFEIPNFVSTVGPGPFGAMGRWVRVTSTQSKADGFRLYLDGILVSENPHHDSNFVTANRSDLYIGGGSPSNYMGRGAWIQSLRIYRRAMTPGEVARLGP